MTEDTQIGHPDLQDCGSKNILKNPRKVVQIKRPILVRWDLPNNKGFKLNIDDASQG